MSNLYGFVQTLPQTALMQAVKYTVTTPNTGDNSKTWLWIILLIVSAALIIFVLFGGKKTKYTAKHLKKK